MRSIASTKSRANPKGRSSRGAKSDEIGYRRRMLGFIVVRGTGILYIQPEELGKEDLGTT